MPLCLNPQCGKDHPGQIKFCSACGTRLFLQDRYVALEAIAEGGFGKTFVASDYGLPSVPRCVIKQFNPDTQSPANLPKALALFEQEAVLLEKLGKHPQIPMLYAYCHQENRQYLVQELVEGQNLEAALEKQGRFNASQIRELLVNFLPVLKFVHDHTIIHRDIKPENIIQCANNTFVLIDFGAAKQVTPTTAPKKGTIIGSATYAAPEQTFGEAVYASDLYGLGVTCLHLLTQVEPFDLYSSLEGRFVWRSYLNGNSVSDDLGRILDKLTQAQRMDRYQTVSDVLRDLLGYTTQPVTLPSPPPPPPSRQVVTPIVPPSARPHATAKTFTDTVNGVSFVMVAIPAGHFNMGSAPGEGQDNERPRHRVKMPTGFWMAECPVTNALWQAVMDTDPTVEYGPKFEGLSHPVVGVSWVDADNFCKKLSQLTRKTYRLPTEAEWEYACRAGSSTQYCFGDNKGQLGDHAWYSSNAGSQTHPVKQKKKNPWDLYDMHGNVWEWCADAWHESYATKPEDLKNGSLIWSSSDELSKLIRGGSWYGNAEHSRSASRLRYHRDDRYNSFGFRLVCAL